jgi:hypothetical protein
LSLCANKIEPRSFDVSSTNPTRQMIIALD